VGRAGLEPATLGLREPLGVSAGLGLPRASGGSSSSRSCSPSRRASSWASSGSPPGVTSASPPRIRTGGGGDHCSRAAPAGSWVVLLLISGALLGDNGNGGGNRASTADAQPSPPPSPAPAAPPPPPPPPPPPSDAASVDKNTRAYIAQVQTCQVEVGLLLLAIRRGQTNTLKLADEGTTARDACDSIRSRLLSMDTTHFDDQATDAWYGVDRLKSGLNAFLAYLDNGANEAHRGTEQAAGGGPERRARHPRDQPAAQGLRTTRGQVVGAGAQLCPYLPDPFHTSRIRLSSRQPRQQESPGTRTAPGLFLVERTGIEPVTSGLQTRSTLPPSAA
jgi:hypothetical protein